MGHRVWSYTNPDKKHNSTHAYIFIHLVGVNDDGDGSVTEIDLCSTGDLDAWGDDFYYGKVDHFLASRRDMTEHRWDDRQENGGTIAHCGDYITIDFAQYDHVIARVWMEDGNLFGLHDGWDVDWVAFASNSNHGEGMLWWCDTHTPHPKGIDCKKCHIDSLYCEKKKCADMAWVLQDKAKYCDQYYELDQ